jgi:plastocyanin
MQMLVRSLIVGAALAALASLAIGAVALGQDREVVIIKDKLAPKRLEVPIGTVVTWRNQDDERHRMRSRQGPVGFDSGNLEPGERFSVTFVVAGEYPYIDERNDEDRSYFGTVVVVDDQPTGGPPPTEATVTLIDESFQPPALEVAVGATVTWENIDGDDDHTVTADDGAFNSGVMPVGTAFEYTFEAPGAFPYFCAIHPEMVGTITVVGDAPAQTEDVAAESPFSVETEEIDDGTVPADATAAETVAATIVDLTFQPPAIEVEAGASVTWTNEDSVPHTVTARSADFNSGVMQQGGTFSQTFDEPGTFDYFCAIHPSMSATVVVAEPAAAAEVVDAAGEPSAGAESAVTEVAVVDVAFEPEDIEVPVGTTVDWINDDPFAHTVTANDGAFDSGTMDAGQTFSQTFDEPGTFDYFCAIHPSMTGTVTITAP